MASRIAEHGLIGDLQSAALVDTAGTIDWLCLPRFDSEPVFAAILGDESAWTMAPTCEVAGTHQFYFPDSAVLVTRFLTEDGVVEVQDFMVPDAERRRLVRRVAAMRGTMELRTECAPRTDDLTLRATVDLDDGCATFAVSEGEVACFELALDAGDDELDHDADFDATNAFWHDWLTQSRYHGRWREMVHRSAITLKLLMHAPTGAILAAPTTSLPERIGGERNWDYRFVWSRDAAFSAYALVRLGFIDEIGAFVGWLLERLRDGRDGEQGPLSPLYDLDGNRHIDEREADLPGHRDSRPVRYGNGAADQLQLDVYGEVIDSVYLYDKHAQPISSQAWDDLTKIVEWLMEHWEQPDEGIWEPRGGRADHTFSRVMTWVAFERMIRMARRRGLPADLVAWTEARDAVYREVMERGWDEERGAFVGEYGDDRLDAALLLMPMVKFVAPTDPRFLSTLAAIEEELVSDSLVFRYREEVDDGVAGKEGTFSICSFWYVEALTRVGRLDDARLALEKMFTYANHLGLYAEQIGMTGEQLGNFPQGFTHLALISAAINLDRALPG